MQRLSALRDPRLRYLHERIDAVDFHRLHADDAERNKQWFVVAFHLERLFRLQPHNHAVRTRLLAALKLTPDTPAGRSVRARLVAFDAARLAACATARPLLTIPPLFSPITLLAPDAPTPRQPARMPYAD